MTLPQPPGISQGGASDNSSQLQSFCFIRSQHPLLNTPSLCIKKDFPPGLTYLKEFCQQKEKFTRGERKRTQLNSPGLCTRYWLDCCRANSSLVFQLPVTQTPLPHHPPREGALEFPWKNSKFLIPCSSDTHIHPSGHRSLQGCWEDVGFLLFFPILPAMGFWGWEKGGMIWGGNLRA